MALSMAHLLINSETVPAKARQALKLALKDAPERRAKHLAAAAASLFQQTDLHCTEVRDLIGLG